jgi:hypothetical protein
MFAYHQSKMHISSQQLYQKNEGCIALYQQLYQNNEGCISLYQQLYQNNEGCIALYQLQLILSNEKQVRFWWKVDHCFP